MVIYSTCRLHIFIHILSAFNIEIKMYFDFHIIKSIHVRGNFTFVEKADKRLRMDDAIELALLGVTDTAASDLISDI